MNTKKKTCGFTQDEFGMSYYKIAWSSSFPAFATILPLEKLSWIAYFLLILLAFSVHYAFRRTKVYKVCIQLDPGFGFACNLGLFVMAGFAVIAKISRNTGLEYFFIVIFLISFAVSLFILLVVKLKYFESIGFDDPWPWANDKKK